MCELDTAFLWLAAASLATAIGCVSVAIAKNLSFCLAPASPAWIAAAGVAVLVAIGFLAGGQTDIDEYWECSGQPAECQGYYGNAEAYLDGVMAVLGVLAAACFAAAGIAWIPWAGAAPMGVIAASLAAEVPLVYFFVEHLIKLVDCVNGLALYEPPDPSLIPVPFAVVVALVLAVRHLRGVPWNFNKLKEDR